MDSDGLLRDELAFARWSLRFALPQTEAAHRTWRTWWLRSATLLLVAGLALQAVPARAQTEDAAGARALFEDARTLMQAGRYSSACPKLEAASKLYRGSGIFLNLGDCYEHLGRTASAWSAFGDAAAAAERLGLPDERTEAKRRQLALEPRLSRLSVVVTNEAPGLVVQRDGMVLDRGAWATPMPVDPGTHTVSASATGRATWQTSVSASEAGKTVTVRVPELAQQTAGEAAPTPAHAAPSAPPEQETSGPPYWTGRRLLGAGLATSGVIAMGVASALVLSAKSQYDTATTETGSRKADDSASAVSKANVATIVFGAGAAVAAAGVIVWLTAPGATGAPAVGTDGARLLLRGTF
jgi:hypothetical protein